MIGLTNDLIDTIEMSKIALDVDDSLLGGDQVDLLIGLKVMTFSMVAEVVTC